MDRHVVRVEWSGSAGWGRSWRPAGAFLKGKPARDLACAMNELFAEIVARHPRRFGAFAVLPLDDMDASIEEMTYALEVLKLDGVSSSTHVAGVYLGDSRFETSFGDINLPRVTLFLQPRPPPNSPPPPTPIT